MHGQPPDRRTLRPAGGNPPAARPSRPSPGAPFDATAGFSDLQWFMFGQGNVVHYAAFSLRAYDVAALTAIARELVGLAPQLLYAWRGAGRPPAAAVFGRLVAVHLVDDFTGFPEAAIDDGRDVVADPDLPMFRVRAFVRRDGPDHEGRAAFLVVRVSHALVEGADSALLSRSRPAVHPVSLSTRATPPLLRLAATGLGGLAALVHLAVGNAVAPRPGPYGFATRVARRDRLTRLARDLGIRQRALCFALVMHALFGAGTPAGKRRISATYSTLDDGGGAHRDSYMRMRMLFTRFANAPDFAAFARAVDAQLAHSELRRAASTRSSPRQACAPTDGSAGCCPSPTARGYLPSCPTTSSSASFRRTGSGAG